MAHINLRFFCCCCMCVYYMCVCVGIGDLYTLTPWNSPLRSVAAALLLSWLLQSSTVSLSPRALQLSFAGLCSGPGRLPSVVSPCFTHLPFPFSDLLSHCCPCESPCSILTQLPQLHFLHYTFLQKCHVIQLSCAHVTYCSNGCSQSALRHSKSCPFVSFNQKTSYFHNLLYSVPQA